MRMNPQRWFNQMRGERVVHAPSSDGATLLSGNVMMPAWDRVPVPDPGPMAYAYEGMTKQPEGALGRGGVAYRPQTVFSGGMFALGTQIRQGTGVGTGTFFLQGLYTPSVEPGD